MKRSPDFFFLAACLLFGTGCAAVPEERVPSVHPRLQEVSTVGILPPEVYIRETTAERDQNTLLTESESASRAIARAIQQELEVRGYQAKLLTLTGDELKVDPELKYDLARLMDKYKNSLGEIMIHLQGWRTVWEEIAVSLGAEVNQFADLTGADAIVLFLGGGEVESQGVLVKRAVMNTMKSIATFGTTLPVDSGEGTSASLLGLCLVHGDDGSILWCSIGDPTQPYNLAKWTDVQKMIQELFREYPDPKHYRIADRGGPS